MDLNYTLLKEDYVVFNLFHTSKNPQVKKQRIRSWFTIAICFGVILFFCHEKINADIYLIAAFFVIILIIYPFILTASYKRNIDRAVNANYGDAYTEQVSITIGSSYIESTDNKSLTRINTPHIKGFVEIGNYFFIKLTSLNYIIIPKRHYQDVDFIRKELFDLSNRYNLPFDIELDWKWR